MADIMQGRFMREQFPEHDRKSTLCSNIFSERKKNVMCIYAALGTVKGKNKQESCDRKNLKQGQVKAHIHEGFSMVRSRCVDTKDSDSISIRHYTSCAPVPSWSLDDRMTIHLCTVRISFLVTPDLSFMI